MFQAARSAVGTVARQVGRSLDALGAALEPHPYYEQCELAEGLPNFEMTMMPSALYITRRVSVISVS